MAIIGTIGVSLTANTTRLTSGLTKAQKSIGRFGRSIRRLGPRLTSFQGLLAGVVGFGLARTTQQMLEAADAQAKFAARLGITTVAMQRWQTVASLSGIEANQLNTAMQRMTRRIGEAAMGTGEARKAMDELGLSVDDLMGLSADRQLRKVMRALAGVTNQSQRLALAMKFFDSEGAALVQMIEDGVAGLDDLEAKARGVGVISPRQLQQIEKLRDEMTLLNLEIRKIVADNAEPLIRMFSGVASYVRSMGDGIKQIRIWFAELRGDNQAVRDLQNVVFNDAQLANWNREASEVADNIERITGAIQGGRVMQSPAGRLQRFQGYTGGLRIQPTMERLQRETAENTKLSTQLQKDMSDDMRRLYEIVRDTGSLWVSI